MDTSRFRSVLLYALLVASLVALAPARSNAAEGPAAAVEDAGFLLYKLPGSAVNPGPAETEVVLAVEIDKAVVATQTVSVPAEDPPRDRLLEVLAGQPAARADIERRLKGGAHDAALVVRVDGKQYQRISWKDLRAAHAAMISTESASAQSLVTQSLTTPQQQCSARCDEEYEYCLRTCEPYSGPNACWDCRDQLQACGSFCASCPRRWRTYGSWVEDRPRRQNTGQLFCLADYSLKTVRYYAEYRQTYVRPVTDFTENCDHSITRVTTFETRYENCYMSLGYFCNTPDDSVTNRKKCPS